MNDDHATSSDCHALYSAGAVAASRSVRPLSWPELRRSDRRERPSTGQPKTVNAIFGQCYNQFSSFGKPMIIGETGSCKNYFGAVATDQANYLRTLDSVLNGTATPPSPNLSQIRALMYFDAQGSYLLPDQSACDWSLDSRTESGGQTGIQAFAALAQDPFFAPTVQQP